MQAKSKPSWSGYRRLEMEGYTYALFNKLCCPTAAFQNKKVDSIKFGWIHEHIPNNTRQLFRFSIFGHANNILTKPKSWTWEPEALANQVLSLTLKWVQWDDDICSAIFQLGRLLPSVKAGKIRRLLNQLVLLVSISSFRGGVRAAFF